MARGKRTKPSLLKRLKNYFSKPGMFSKVLVIACLLYVVRVVEWAIHQFEMQSSTGEEKKEAVLVYVHQKVEELKLPYTDEDIDKAIESVYSTVKDVVNAAAGTVVINTSAPDPVTAE